MYFPFSNIFFIVLIPQNIYSFYQIHSSSITNIKRTPKIISTEIKNIKKPETGPSSKYEEKMELVKYQALPDKIWQTKIKSFCKLIRSHVLFPTTLLCMVGGWIIKPSLTGILHSPRLFISTIITLCITSSSMIINDLFDIPIDRINNPDRPLVKGDITITEAIVSIIGFIGISEGLNLYFLPDNLRQIVHLAIFNIFIYTPILKKIPLIKNILCGGMVSLSIFLSALSSSDTIMAIQPNFRLLSMILTMTFLGSLYNEILADMRDIDGDRKNNIYTIPVIFGITNTWYISCALLNFNVIMNTFSIYYLYNSVAIASCIPFLFFPMMRELYKVKYLKYQRDSIIKATSISNITLLGIVFYICVLASLPWLWRLFRDYGVSSMIMAYLPWVWRLFRDYGRNDYL